MSDADAEVFDPDTYDGPTVTEDERWARDRAEGHRRLEASLAHARAQLASQSRHPALTPEQNASQLATVRDIREPRQAGDRRAANAEALERGSRVLKTEPPRLSSRLVGMNQTETAYAGF
jgi:hypothetical protein